MGRLLQKLVHILRIDLGAAAGCTQSIDLTQLDYRNAEAGEKGDS